VTDAPARFKDLCLDARDHQALADWETPPARRRRATLLRARDDDIRWDVLADPEGNEFCCFAPDAQSSAQA